jgi:hypothetical protein
MLRFKFKKGDKLKDPEMIKAKFKRYVDKKKKALNELSSEAKVVAAITKALAMQGEGDKANYYIASEELWCPRLEVTPGNINSKTKQRLNSYRARGRFKVGKLINEELSMGVIDFNISFRDSEDEMGLPDLVIEEASMDELSKSTPVRG